MKRAYILYLKDDVYSLPCAVLDTKADCARWLGVSVEHFCVNLSRGTATKGYYCYELILLED